MSEMPEAIAKALVSFQANNSAMTLDKTGNRSQYASIGSMMTLVRKAAVEYGLGISFPVRRTENNEYFISPVIVHSSGVSWSSPDLAWPLIVDDMTHCQKLGSAMSYGRRYLLQGILGLAAGIAELDDDDDDDGEANFDFKGWADAALATIKTANKSQLDKWDKKNTEIIKQAETTAPDVYNTVGIEYTKKLESFK
tara:strand:- start:501 stop:1088 length:588 start_codon:yes stop_codon:yes gene_type:complete